MSKTFLLNLLLLLTVNILIKPFYAFGIDLPIQQLTGSDYGLYFALWNFTALFQIFADLGLQQYNNKEVAAQGDFFFQNIKKMLSIKLALSFLMCASTIIAAIIVGYTGGDIVLLMHLLLSQLCISLTLFLRTNISGLGYFKLDSLLSSLDKFLLLIFGAILLYSGLFSSITIHDFVYMQNLAYGITAIFTLLLVFYFYKKGVRSLVEKKALSLSLILKQSWVFAATVLLMMIYNRVDVILLERLLPQDIGRAQAEIYAFVYRFYDMFTMVGFLFASLLLPMYAKMQNDKKALQDLAYLGSSLLTIFNIGIMCIMLLFKEDIAYNANQLPAFILLLSLPMGGLIQIWGTLITALNRLRKALWLFAAAILLNVLLNLYFIPTIGVAGVAFTALITQSMVGLVEWIWGLSIIEAKVNIKTIIQWLVFLCFTSILYCSKEYYIQEDKLFLNIIIFGLLYTAITLITGVFAPKKLLVLLKQKI